MKNEQKKKTKDTKLTQFGRVFCIPTRQNQKPTKWKTKQMKNKKKTQPKASEILYKLYTKKYKEEKWSKE